MFARRKTLNVPLSLTLVVIGCVIWTGFSPGRADNIEVEDPTPPEVTVFNVKLARLTGHAAQHPLAITDAIQSLTNPVQIVLNCEAGDSVEKVTINITTTLKKWDKAIATQKNGKDNTIGAYIWDMDVGVDGHNKTINATNYIMLDPKVSVKQENAESAPLGPIADETLLYHELLHGQLLINAMRADSAWKHNVCSCEKPSTDPQDANHLVIAGLEETFMTAISGAGATVRVVRPLPESADQNGEFEFDLGPFTKEGEEWGVVPYFPDNNNIDKGSLTFEIREDKLYAKGKLVNKLQRGYLLVQVDPPAYYLVSGIEESMVVLPVSSSGVPTTSQWGLVFTVILLLSSGVIVFRRWRQSAGRIN